MLILVCIRLWLVQGLFLAARNYFFDDLLYLDHGRTIINGQWLGAYNETTLVKGPGYPLWIALSFFSSIPLLLSQNIFYIVACSLLIYALLPFAGQRYPLLFVLFCALLFDPQAYSSYNLRVVRDFLYSTQHLLVLACLVGLLSQRDKIVGLFWWALGLGGGLAFLWLTREESFLLLPAVVLLLGYTGWRIWREKGEQSMPRMCLLLMPLGVLVMANMGVCLLNNHYYGIPAVVEQNSTPVKQALSALQRVKQAAWHRYIPLPKETREKIYPVSSAFAELRPSLEGEIGKMWTEMSASRLPELAGREDIGGGWYTWALLDSVKGAGYYRSGQTTMNYYARLAAEVNAACADGRLACYPSPHFGLPKHLGELFPHILRSFVDLCRYLASYEQNQPVQQASLLNSDEEYVNFVDITLNNIAPPSGQTLPTINQNQINQWKFDILQKIYLSYKSIIPVIYGLAGCCLLLIGGFSLWSRTAGPLMIINLTILAIILPRILGLAYIDATACSARPYLGPLYPLTILASFLLCLNLAELVSHYQKKCCS